MSKSNKSSSNNNSNTNKSNKSSANKSSKSSTNKSSTSKSSAVSKKKTKAQLKRERQRRLLVMKICAVFILGIVLAFSMFFEARINAYLRLKGIIEQEYEGLSTMEATGEGTVLSGERLNIHFIDVGQGDACIIELPDERKMIIDGGKDKEKTKLLDYIDNHIRTDNGEKISKFDIAILTHSDEDHCGGLDDVLNEYPADVFYRPNQLATYKGYNDPGKNLLYGNYIDYPKSTLAYMRAIQSGHDNSTKVIVTDATNDSQNRIVPNNRPSYHPEYYEINFYTPTKAHYTDVNDYSPIIILEYQGKKIALSGDAEMEAEMEFVELAGNGEGRYSVFDVNYSVDLVKLGHHGSRSSSNTEYLEAITTASNLKNVMIIISCGLDNSYGHPHGDMLSRLYALGFKEENVLRTDINGNIAMSIREDESANFQLYYGAEMVRVSYKKPVGWREIALSIFLGAVAIVFATELKRIKSALPK